MAKTPEQLAQEQLDAYNSHDIEAFLNAYSEDCEIYNQSTGEIMMKGHDAMRERYGKMFNERPKLYADLIKRMTLGNFAIDQEEVTISDTEHSQAIAIYEVKDNLIRKVWFIKP